MDSVAVSEAVDPGSTPGACTTFKRQKPKPRTFHERGFGFWPFYRFAEHLDGTLCRSRESLYSSVYFSDRPFAFSTGYLAALAAILVSITAATSMPVMLANSSA